MLELLVEIHEFLSGVLPPLDAMGYVIAHPESFLDDKDRHDKLLMFIAVLVVEFQKIHAQIEAEIKLQAPSNPDDIVH